MPKFVVLTGAGSWQVPEDWNNANNSVHVIGGGAGGRPGPASNTGSTGGGGGAYASSSNITLTKGALAYYSAGAIAASNTSGNDSWFNYTTNAAPANGTQGVLAKAGLVGVNDTTGGVGGLASASFGTVRFNGGSGGARVVTGTSTGGGGAAGPDGAGTNANNTNNISGGDGNAGVTPGGGLGGTNGAAGGDGEIWTDTDTLAVAGSGGGGGGRSTNGIGGAGGLYGGGGGGGRGNGQLGGVGDPGVVVLVYEPIITLTHTGVDDRTGTEPNGKSDLFGTAKVNLRLDKQAFVDRPDAFGQPSLVKLLRSTGVDNSTDSFGSHRLNLRLQATAVNDSLELFGAPLVAPDQNLAASGYVDPDVIGGIEVLPGTVVVTTSVVDDSVDHFGMHQVSGRSRITLLFVPATT